MENYFRLPNPNQFPLPFYFFFETLLSFLLHFKLSKTIITGTLEVVLYISFLLPFYKKEDNKSEQNYIKIKMDKSGKEIIQRVHIKHLESFLYKKQF